MKLIYIANARIPTEKAHGIQIMKMCEAFSAQGVEVELVVPWRFNHIKDNPFTYYDVEENFKITTLPSVDLVNFGRIGFVINTIVFTIVNFWYVIFKRADVFYCRDEMPLYFINLFRKNTVYEAHLPRFNFFIKYSKSKIITITDGLKQFYINKGVSKERISVAPDAVDIGKFKVESSKLEVREKLNIPADKPVVMYIGRLDKWKGIETLLQASRNLKDVNMVIVGEGKETERLKAEYIDVIFCGMLPYRDLAYNQQAADVLVIPNSGKSEVSRLYTSPLKVFAHMASGIPIVSSDLPSIREILSESNSVLVEPDNPEKLAEGINKVLNDSNLAERISKQAYADVQEYTWSKRVENIIHMFNGLQV
jgi:glycosyltransferase involved in cell wall biosynthesis